jgi:PAS domain S-box-containing protein
MAGQVGVLAFQCVNGKNSLATSGSLRYIWFVRRLGAYVVSLGTRFMDMQLYLPTASEVPVLRRPVARDLIIVIIVTAFTFVASATFELREWLTDFTRPLEPYQIDELPLTFAALLLALAWFSWRRWRQSDIELRLRVAAQRALVEREAQYRTLFMENLAGNALAGSDGTMLLCNPAMARILGLASPEEAVGRNLGDYYSDPALWTSHREALARGEKLEISLLELRSADGSAAKAIARMLPRYSPGKAVELQVYLADITELQLMQKNLADTLAENRLLSQKYLQAQEEERRNLARELHDELGQCLNAIKLDAVSIRELTKGSQPEIEVSASSIVDISNHVYDAVRSMMQRLRPAALDALGLRDAVGELVNQWRRRNPSTDCQLESQGDLVGLGELLNITVYRLVQECLTNVTKHSGATQARVVLERAGPQEVRVTVHDNGRGMDLQEKRTGLGLVGLRERVEALRGRLQLTARPGSGMHLTAYLPAVPAN